MNKIYESDIEEMALNELSNLGYDYIFGPDISPESDMNERNSYSDVILKNRVISAMKKLNPDISEIAINDAYKKLANISFSDIVEDNEKFHKMLIEGINVEYRINNEIRGIIVKICDFENPLNNEFVAINQYTIIENGNNKRPDILIFINGIPLIVFELKNPTDEDATIRKAFEQLETYKESISSLFTYNEINIISDGLEAKIGSITSPYSRFNRWKTKDGITEIGKYEDQLSVLINGLLNKNTLLDYIRFFITFEREKIENENNKVVSVRTIKKIAAYHQYYAVNKAIDRTISSSQNNTCKAGVIWHTQGSGKSLSMVFYSGKLIQKMNNPTILIITDRNDLDDQLFDTFVNNNQLLRQMPQQANDCSDLRTKLNVKSGGVIFSTIQKFVPDSNNSFYDKISDRHNIVVIADEAHRTQYGFNAKIKNVKDENHNIIGQKITYGFAKYIRDALPYATFIGFTGTPIEKTDVNTPAVFGQYIDIYDINQAVEDKVTVKLYYESRLAKVNITEEGRELIKEFDDSLEDEDITEENENYTDNGVDVAKRKWATLEKIVGNNERIKNVAFDIVNHFESRQKSLSGKAMIVAMSRRIASELYDEIIKLRPDWEDKDLNKGVIKVVMTTSSSDGPQIQKHHTTKSQRKALALRMRDENDSLKIVIVRDMWLTGFDAPCLNTMYIDKPMHEHNLMQAIARVNRVFKDKPGGLIVDYIGIGTSLKRALNFYAQSGGKGIPIENQERAVDILKDKIEVLEDMFSNFDYKNFFDSEIKDRLSIILKAEDYVLSLNDGKNRFTKETTLLSQAYALSKPHPYTFQVAEKVAFFQAIKARISKFERNLSEGSNKKNKNYDSIIKNIVDVALSSNEVIDVFEAAGLDKPEISVLSDEFLQEVKGMKYKNIAVAMLQKILNDEVKIRSKYNITQAKTLMDMLDSSVKKYQNNLLDTAQIIEELIKIAKEIRSSDERGIKLNLNKDELAFYDALEVNDSAVAVLGDEQLRQIARELSDKVRTNATIDWTMKESVRAKLMVLVRRTLKKYGYPPDKQEKAIKTVLEQAKNLADYWTDEGKQL